MPDEHNLEQLLGKGLEGGHHADFFQYFVRKILGFVDYQDRSLACAITFEQPVIEAKQDLTLRAGVAGNPKIRHHVVQKLRHVHPGVEDECGWDLLCAQPFEQLVDQRGLAGSDFAGQQDEPFPALDAIREAGQSFFGVPG